MTLVEGDVFRASPDRHDPPERRDPVIEASMSEGRRPTRHGGAVEAGLAGDARVPGEQRQAERATVAVHEAEDRVLEGGALRARTGGAINLGRRRIELAWGT